MSSTLRYTIVSKGKRYHLSRDDIAAELQHGHVHEGTLTWRTDGGGVTTVGALLKGPEESASVHPTSHAPSVDFPSDLGVSLASLGMWASILTGASYVTPIGGLLLAVVALGEGTFAGAIAALAGSIVFALMLYGVAQGLGLVRALAERAGVSAEPVLSVAEPTPALSPS